MRNSLRVTAVALAMLAALPAAAGKIGFVEAERAVATVQEGQAMLAQMEEWAKPKEQRIERIQSEITALREQILKQSGVASKEAIERLQNEELAARRSLEDETRRLQREFEQKQDELLRPVAEKLNQVVSEYAEANGYDAVLIFKPRTIIYLSQSADITDAVIKIYDERYQVN